MTRPHPTDEGDTEYAVRLLFNVNAASPEHAVERFIDQVNSSGFKTWVYRVMNVQNQNEFMVHPEERRTYTMDEFAERMAELSEEDLDVEDVATDGRV